MATIPIPALTQEIIDRGSIEVRMRPSANTAEWGPLPFHMVAPGNQYIYTIEPRYVVGALKLYYFFQVNTTGGSPPNIQTDVIADLPIRWTIRP